MAKNPLEDFIPGDLSESNYDTFDFHKPYVDDIVLVSSTGEKMHREPMLIDVWFDSGAMPYAQCSMPLSQVLRNPYPAIRDLQPATHNSQLTQSTNELLVYAALSNAAVDAASGAGMAAREDNAAVNTASGANLSSREDNPAADTASGANLSAREDKAAVDTAPLCQGSCRVN